MLHDTPLRAAVLATCQQRGLQPADSYNDPPLTRSDFHLAQLPAAIHNRWAGRYDHAQPVGRVAAWITAHTAEPLTHAALVISGDTGTGKTHNAVAAIRALATHRPGIRWQAVTHPDLGDELRPKTDGSHEYALQPYLDVPLLLLDDLGAGMSTPWTVDCASRLIDHRWTRRMATIYTTNLGADALRAAVGDRVVSRLGDATHVHLEGADRRWTR